MKGKVEARVMVTPSSGLLHPSVKQEVLTGLEGKIKRLVLDELHFGCLGDFQVEMLSRKLDM